MNIERYFQSISSELDVLKDRVRCIIRERHWLTDGEWKESVLRSVVKRSAPETISIGRGFIVDRDRVSTQIDLLIYDNSYPVLYKDGDLVFISPASCRAIIEVKTKTTRRQFLESAAKLGSNAEIARDDKVGHPPVFVGIFVYESSNGGGQPSLEDLREAARGNSHRIVDHVSIGASRFMKYWSRNPDNEGWGHHTWHDYELERMAQGYFVHNLVTELATKDAARREPVWFPEQSKEVWLRESVEFIQSLTPRRVRSCG